MTSLFPESLLLLLFSSQVISDFLRPHGLQYTRLPCPSPSPRVFPSSCPLNQWCHSTISSSVIPLFSCLQSFPASGSFPMKRLFTSGGQSIRASASVLPMSIQCWFSLRLTCLISLLSKGLSKVFSSTTVWKHHFFGALPSLRLGSWSTLDLRLDLLSHPYMTIGKTVALTGCTFVSKVMSLLFNTPPRFFIAFLPRSNYLLTSWLHSLYAVILEPKNRKSVTASAFSPSICHEVMRLDAMILVFLILNFKLAFSLFSFTLIKRLFSSSSLSAIRVISSAYLRLLVFFPAILIPAYNSSSLAFLITCYAYKLNKQGDNKQPCHSPFSILNQSVVPYKVLTVASWNAYKFHIRQKRRSVFPSL